MRIREIRWGFIPMWPPQWSFSDDGAGEEGVLTDVKLHQDLRDFIWVQARHNGNTRSGIILLEDFSYLKALYRILKNNIGNPLVMIGGLEVAF